MTVSMAPPTKPATTAPSDSKASGTSYGNVKDGNTGGYLNGATVTDRNDPAVQATTVATPDDTALPDGFFWLLAKPGSRTFEAKAGNYSDVPAQGEWQLDPQAAYVHYTTNETIGGVEYHWTPDTGEVPLRYQPYLVDPTGRFFEIELRKLF